MISRRHFIRASAGVGTLGISSVAYGFGVEPLHRLRITSYNLNPPQWPSDFPLKIGVIADLHACDPWMSHERIETIVARTNALKPDIIVLLGDYVAGMRKYARPIASNEWAPLLGKLKAPLGVHAILGNHDWWDDLDAQRDRKGPIVAHRELEKAGIPVYNNDAVRLKKDGRPFWLAGLGDQLAYWPQRRRINRLVERLGDDDLDATLAKVTDDAPVILLAHEPDIAVKVPPRVALQLSGHTHGGQVRVLGWAPIMNSRYPDRLSYGHTRMNCDVVVSAGLGCSIVPFRFGVVPEIVQVTLGRSPGTT